MSDSRCRDDSGRCRPNHNSWPARCRPAHTTSETSRSSGSTSPPLFPAAARQLVYGGLRAFGGGDRKTAQQMIDEARGTHGVPLQLGFGDGAVSKTRTQDDTRSSSRCVRQRHRSVVAAVKGPCAARGPLLSTAFKGDAMSGCKRKRKLSPRRWAIDARKESVHCLAAAGFRAAFAKDCVAWKNDAGDLHCVHVARRGGRSQVSFNDRELALGHKAARELDVQPGRYRPAGPRSEDVVRGRDPIAVGVHVAKHALRPAQDADRAGEA